MSRVQYITKSIARTGIGGLDFTLDRRFDSTGLPGVFFFILVIIDPKVIHEAGRV